MIKRPLHPRFRDPVITGKKTTTIRDKPWPVGVPIMLYNWTGAPYRSKQSDVAAVIVTNAVEIEITRNALGIGYWEPGTDVFLDLWAGEGFESQNDMDSWFKEVIKPGQSVKKHIMRLSLSP